ncbi:3',5'-cyclic-nucleotide phosphodiesterase [Gallibacterium genomosp. 3]|uniref:3',5'-cyclic adenosine monophosphate phosphodiesterase CpdA n=1 Tax=Gallibacterium genomosp. 3 TaxID=505345 RepID=A0A1A7PTG5_9PAST|nr:3',5'-cyclic-AMP phosphodiesterase [Gallibacterium genomosp. 3]OBX05012.1 3',5'-cyclic-nucleotide phosphodiesterase [Gallibacterium genomosp. 3]
MSDLFQDESAGVIRLLKVTDPHLFADAESELLGINTFASFQQVLSEIKNSGFESDFILATGDFVQDGSEEGYHRFVKEIAQLGKKVFWIPGNHDFQPKMEAVFDVYKAIIQPHKHLLLGEHWQVLLLDSQLYGVPHGMLSEDELAWLEHHLLMYPERNTLVVLHHHLVPTRSAWLDQHNLRNPYDFSEVLAKHKKVKGIFYGHIHQEVNAQWQGIPVFATPSTCIQFKPDCAHFTLDSLQPGWREITLHPDGHIETKVQRIKEKVFLPKDNMSGY